MFRTKPAYQSFEHEINNRILKFLAGINISVKSKIVVSFLIIIFLMGGLNVLLMVSSFKYNMQYNTIVTNITTANSLNAVVKRRIDSVMWDIVAGKIQFEEGNQFEIIEEVNNKIMFIMNNETSPESRTKLDVILRTMDTLTRYVNLLGVQMRNKSTVAENEKVLENIRGVSELVEDNIQEFILYELAQIEKVKVRIESSIKRWFITDIAVLCMVLIFSFIATWAISESISKPIKKLHETTATVAEKNLQVKVNDKNVDEITGLGLSFNIMVGKIKELLENSIKEQENLKKAELKALQAQIKPHFLYNTLDTIVWMAEANRTGDVIEIVKALSNFFRISLSKGKDWITVREEVEHIRSYLIIQRMRYSDIMDFQIDADEDIMDENILKFTLQPIVENALYHGIKNKREGGRILIKGYRTHGNTLVFEVVDDGLGMTPERLAEVKAELDNDSIEPVIKESGFGLNNVHKRIKLYYGADYGLSIESEYKRGTRVTLRIPAQFHA